MNRLIVIEGADGAGKNTQSKRIVEHLRAIGHTAHLYSFPRYGTPLGAAIRRHLMKEIALVEDPATRAPEDAMMFQCLMLADKSDAAVSIREHLKNGDFVVCDRWIPSSYCYGKADGLDPEWLDRMHASLPVADLNIYLDVSPEETLRRRPAMRDRYEENRELQQRVRENYQQLWLGHHEEKAWWWIVDGESHLPHPEACLQEVENRIWGLIRHRGML